MFVFELCCPVVCVVFIFCAPSWTCQFAERKETQRNTNSQIQTQTQTPTKSQLQTLTLTGLTNAFWHSRLCCVGLWSALSFPVFCPCLFCPPFFFRRPCLQPARVFSHDSKWIYWCQERRPTKTQSWDIMIASYVMLQDTNTNTDTDTDTDIDTDFPGAFIYLSRCICGRNHWLYDIHCSLFHAWIETNMIRESRANGDVTMHDNATAVEDTSSKQLTLNPKP